MTKAMTTTMTTTATEFNISNPGSFEKQNEDSSNKSILTILRWVSTHIEYNTPALKIYILIAHSLIVGLTCGTVAGIILAATVFGALYVYKLRYQIHAKNYLILYY